MERMQKQGFGLVFDGVWGDMLFQTNLQNLARAGSWQQALQYIRGQQRWYSTLWNEFVLPQLPKFWQSYWFARRRRKQNPLPPWVTPSYAQKPQTQVAIQQYSESFLPKSLVQNITCLMEDVALVAPSQLYRLMRYAHQLESTSPLQDRRLVEFVISLHPSLQNDPIHEKIFLRRANHLTLPEDVLWRPKDNYFDPLKDAGIGKGEQALKILEQAQHAHLLQNVIDLEQFGTHLKQYRKYYSENYRHQPQFNILLKNQIYILLGFLKWQERVNNEIF
jgi:asparagine synthase (glutamine-hydrolysing)